MPDEAERSLVPEVTSRENLPRPPLLGPIAAIPGLRVGYAIASPDMVVRPRQYQDPWTITPVAEAAALAILEDVDTRPRVLQLLAEETPRLTQRLWEIPGLRLACLARP